MNADSNIFKLLAKINITKFPPQPNGTTSKGNRNAPRPWPENKRAEVEIEFLSGFLADYVIRGITIWETKDGELSVTPPNRKYKQDGEDRFYDFLFGKRRTARETFKAFVTQEYRRALTLQAELAGSIDDEPPAEDD